MNIENKYSTFQKKNLAFLTHTKQPKFISIWLRLSVSKAELNPKQYCFFVFLFLNPWGSLKRGISSLRVCFNELNHKERVKIGISS